MKIGVIITPNRKKSKISRALEEENIEFEYIDLLSENWEAYFERNFDGFLIYPPASPDDWKSIFIKRLIIIEEKLRGKAVPDLKSILLYESKVTMHDFYKINKLPHVSSFTTFNYRNAHNYAKTCKLPVIVKEDTGSGAIGVTVVKGRRKLINYVHKSFLFNNRVRKYIDVKTVIKALKSYYHPYKIFIDSNKQYFPKERKKSGLVHFQSYINIKNEWRIIRIGNSYFGHKKLEDKNGYHSGSLNKEWGSVNLDLLNLVRDWSDSLLFESMCFDIFEDYEGNYFINELQTMFGTSTEEQLIIDGQKGRYIYRDGNWVFESGNFAKNGCNNLRIQLLIGKVANVTQGM